MTLMPSFTPGSASASPMRTLRSSDSTTQGPAMRNGAVPPPNRSAMSVGQLGQLGGGSALGVGGARLTFLVLERGPHETGEQGVGAHRPRLELRVELAADEPRVIGQLDHLDQGAVRRQAGAAHAVFGEHVAVRVRHLVAVAVALAHLGGAVHLSYARAGPQPAGIGAQPHGAAHFLYPFLRPHQRDHWVLALRLELAGVRVADLADVAGEVYNPRLVP